MHISVVVGEASLYCNIRAKLNALSPLCYFCHFYEHVMESALSPLFSSLTFSRLLPPPTHSLRPRSAGARQVFHWYVLLAGDAAHLTSRDSPPGLVCLSAHFA